MTRRLSSHRFRRRLLWAGSAVAVLVVVVGGAIRVGNTGKHYDNTLVDKPAWVYKTPPAADLTKAERHEVMDVMNRFIQTAVARKHLPEAYTLVTNQIRQGQTLKSWNTGNIAVIPYPVADVKYAPMKIDFSYPNEAQIQVALLPKQGAKIRSQLFIMDLVKRNGKWLVNAWVPRSSPPVPNGSANNGAGG